jgi:hypothetical protein
MSILDEPDYRIKFNKYDSIQYTVRSAQAILQFGVGAMVDFPEQTLMVAAPEYWAQHITKFYDERLQRALMVDYFGLPEETKDYGIVNGLSYVRFPQWYFCPKCRRFQPLNDWEKEYQAYASHTKLNKEPYMTVPRCFKCKQILVPARVVVACKHGHIDDFPWINWVHQRNFGGEKRICEHPHLKINTGATATAGLEGIVIQCTTCGAKATLNGAFDPQIFARLDEQKGTKNFVCSGNAPWKHAKEICKEYPKTILRGASSVYFPKTVSSLIIPPFSNIINVKIEKSIEFKNCLTKIEGIKEVSESDAEYQNLIKKSIPQWANKIAIEIAFPTEDIKSLLERKLLNDSEENILPDSIKYRSQEYQALTNQVGRNFDISKQNDFAMEVKSGELYSIPGIKQISLISKMREVRALIGFSRLYPFDSSDMEESDSNEQDIFLVPIKEKETRWYPAYEVRGEGVFIEFDNEILNQWLKKEPMIQSRIDILRDNYSKTTMGKKRKRHITAKFVFLHTMAHLLIRAMSFECGYSVASLRERIYSAEIDADGEDMSGILIYTASGDSEGTMGGLVRQGMPDILPHIFKRALNESLICSNDPVCISTSNGQGRDGLNLAACHACVLLPETSCEEFNIFLDRAMVIGTFENNDIGFYSKWIR